jgi:ABC-2 type transport system permease protein
MRLLLVELNRFRSRRAIALMLLGVILFVVWMAFDTIWSTRSVSASEIEGAKQQAAQELEFYQEDHDRCVEDPSAYFGSEDLTAADCPVAEVDHRWYLTRQPLSLQEELGDTGTAGVVILAGIAIIVGATFAGADWSTGSLSNQLLFRPRRGQVWVAKAVAVTVGVTAVAAVVLAVQWGAYLAVAEARDIGHPSGFTETLLEKLARGLALVAGGGLGGFALTMLLRSTVGTLAVLFFFSVGGEALIANLPFDKVARWSLGNNVFAWLDNGIQVYDESIPCDPSGLECNQTFTLSLAHGATFLLVMLAVAVVLSLVLFRRRDVP